MDLDTGSPMYVLQAANVLLYVGFKVLIISFVSIKNVIILLKYSTYGRKHKKCIFILFCISIYSLYIHEQINIYLHFSLFISPWHDLMAHCSIVVGLLGGFIRVESKLFIGQR